MSIFPSISMSIYSVRCDVYIPSISMSIYPRLYFHIIQILHSLTNLASTCPKAVHTVRIINPVPVPEQIY